MSALPQPGDLVFFRGDLANPVDCAIMARTGGDLVHVEIVCAVDGSQVQTIGALAQGIVRHPLPARGILAATSAHTSPARLPAALVWLGEQVGQPYGWTDILDQGESLLDPQAPLISSGAMDCSHLAATFLARAGYPLPASLMAQPPLISPVALARAVGVPVGPASQFPFGL